jgi:hypothetical protein
MFEKLPFKNSFSKTGSPQKNAKVQSVFFLFRGAAAGQKMSSSSDDEPNEADAETLTTRPEGTKKRQRDEGDEPTEADANKFMKLLLREHTKGHEFTEADTEMLMTMTEEAAKNVAERVVVRSIAPRGDQGANCWTPHPCDHGEVPCGCINGRKPIVNPDALRYILDLVGGPRVLLTLQLVCKQWHAVWRRVGIPQITHHFIPRVVNSSEHPTFFLTGAKNFVIPQTDESRSYACNKWSEVSIHLPAAGRLQICLMDGEDNVVPNTTDVVLLSAGEHRRMLKTQVQNAIAKGPHGLCDLEITYQRHGGGDAETKRIPLNMVGRSRISGLRDTSIPASPPRPTECTKCNFKFAETEDTPPNFCSNCGNKAAKKNTWKAVVHMPGKVTVITEQTGTRPPTSRVVV